MRLLLTRPQHDARNLEIILKNFGIQSVVEPLLDIIIFDGPDIDCHDITALVMTSANGVRAFVARSQERNIPVFAVGESTALIAKNSGFLDVNSANGDVESLTELIIRSLTPSNGVILHPAASNVAGDLKGQLAQAGILYRREIIYKAVPAVHLNSNLVEQIIAKEIDGVVLFSPRTADIFKALSKKAGVIKHLCSMRVYCLSPAVAKKIVDLPWLEVCIAKHPSQAALLDLLEAPENT